LRNGIWELSATWAAGELEKTVVFQDVVQQEKFLHREKTERR
jgi:hypothetical protein